MGRLLFPAFLLAAVLPLHGAEWPQFRGPHSDGTTAEKVAAPWSGGKPKELWRTPSEGGFSSFAIAAGRAFTLSLKSVEGARQESLVALDADTGKELWSAPLNFGKYDRGGDAGAS